MTIGMKAWQRLGESVDFHPLACSKPVGRMYAES